MGINNVKIEGSGKDVQNFIRLASDSSLNITGHLGLLPQTAENFRLQGKTPEAEKILLAEVEILKKLKIKYLVLECIPEKLGKKITEKLKKTDIETIGIGAGRYTDGQVLVFDDIVGKFPEKFGKKAKFAKKFCDFYEIGCMAIKNFTQEVREKKYPSILEIYK